MDSIQVVPLGAGQDVGRSCVIVSLGGKNIMFDCGMHMGYADERRFPDFSYLAPLDSTTGKAEMATVIDAVIVTHFHLDHCGALPYFTEVVGYSGPVFMTYPTKAICPILLEDYRKIMVDRKGETDFFSSSDITACMNKVVPLNLHQSHIIPGSSTGGLDIEIKPYYAGHVIGAAMFYVRVGSHSVVYTGDYNMTPDRHLGAASIDRLCPDLLITESTYATTIRDSKRQRERDFLRQVHETVDKGGKVLIPVFALGRAQELAILIETYWERMGLNVPVFFSAGLTTRANYFYKLFISWTNQKIKSTFVERNMFDFKHIATFDRQTVDLDAPGPMVMFATPGMLHAGMSLTVFKHWAPDPKNMVILPGYCVSGTVGNKLLTSPDKRIEIEKGTVIDVRCQVKYLSFSAHADAKGIMQLIRQAAPRNVMLVHGEHSKMKYLSGRITQEFGLSVFCPPNEEPIVIPTPPRIPLDISSSLLAESLPPLASYSGSLTDLVGPQLTLKDGGADDPTSRHEGEGGMDDMEDDEHDDEGDGGESRAHQQERAAKKRRLAGGGQVLMDEEAKETGRLDQPVGMYGVLVVDDPAELVHGQSRADAAVVGPTAKLLTPKEAVEALELPQHQLKMETTLPIPPTLSSDEILWNRLLSALSESVSERVEEVAGGKGLQVRDEVIVTRSEVDRALVSVSWPWESDELGESVVEALENILGNS